MDENVARGLATDKVIDITTVGRSSGQPKRIEIWYHRVDGRYYITGRPGPRSWYANLLANPALTFHLKETTQADLPARAVAITDPAEKARILGSAESLREFVADDLQAWVDGSPLVEVVFEGD